MENKKIQKIYNLGNNVIVRVVITDNLAIMYCNFGKELYKIYIKAKEEGKNVQYNLRTNTMIEKFNIPIKEYEKNLDTDYKTALIKQKEAMEKTKKKFIKKNE